jgi:DNA-binding CsgD family transcriptional regulator
MPCGVVFHVWMLHSHALRKEWHLFEDSPSHFTERQCIEAILALIPALCHNPTQLNSALHSCLAHYGFATIELHFSIPHRIPPESTIIAADGYRYGWVDGMHQHTIAAACGMVIAEVERHLLHRYRHQHHTGQPHAPLTVREREVLTLSHTGMSNKLIAEALHITPATVNSHSYTLRDTFNVRFVREAVAIADAAGFFHYLRQF